MCLTHDRISPEVLRSVSYTVERLVDKSSDYVFYSLYH